MTPLQSVALGHIDYNDQLRYILDFIKLPDAHDMAFLSEASAI